MNRSFRPLALALAIALGVTLAGRPRAQSTVEISRERRAVPGLNEPNTPPNVQVSEALRGAITDPLAYRNDQLDLNQAVFVRYYDRHRTAPPKSVVVFVPGLAAGANLFSPLSREIVRLSNGDTEAWAIDPRANLLEDTAPMIQAERTGTMPASLDALRIYRDHPAGRAGYIANHPFEVSPFMSEWGLDVFMRDLKAVIDEAHRAGGSSPVKVFLAGHDYYAANLVAMFAAYRFEDISGYALLSGLILLDGTPAPNSPFPGNPRPPSASTYLNGPVVISTSLQVPGLNALRNPQGPGDLPFLVNEQFSPYAHQLSEIAAQLAVVDPDGPAAAPTDLGPTVPATNAVAMAVMVDDEFADADDERLSVGFLHVPAGGKAGDVATRVNDPAGANPAGFFTPRNLGTDASGATVRQRWDSINDLSSIGISGKEPSDFRTACASYLVGAGNADPARGEANYRQWFYPTRLLLDLVLAANLNTANLAATVVSAQTARGGNRVTVTENARVNIPILGLPAERGILVHNVPAPFPWSYVYFVYAGSLTGKPLFSMRLLPDYAHRDVTFSSDPLVPSLILEFVNTGKLS